MSHDIKHNIKQQSTWKRGLYMLLFSVFYQIAIAILFFIVIFQFTLKLLTGETNDQLRQLSRSIGDYIYRIIQFLSFNSDEHPYPFGNWPESKPETAKSANSSAADVGELKSIERDGD